MTQIVWRSIISSKAFYIQSYRRVVKVIVVSLVINLILCSAISYRYFHQPVQDFYATNGVTPPILLTPLAVANQLNKPLLEADPITMDHSKYIPQ